MLERGPDVSFANCGLPYYVGGEITDRKKLLIVTPAQLRARFNLDVRTHSAAEGIDRAVKKVRIRAASSRPSFPQDPPWPGYRRLLKSNSDRLTPVPLSV